MSYQKSACILNVSGLALLLLTGILVFLFWQKSNRAELENNRLDAEMQGLELEKSMIERELDSLRIDYQYVQLENEALCGQSATTSQLAAQKDLAIQQIRAENQRGQAALHRQVEELRKSKIEYETLITAVRGENDRLRAINRQLTGENTQLRDKNTQLTTQKERLARLLEEQIRRTQTTRFKATSFRVEILRKSELLTARARKAREMYVRFDLADVPENFRNVQKLYLAITDEKGRPIHSLNPIKTTVQAPTGPVAVLAQQVKQVALGKTQRLSFAYKFDDRLQSGNYVVAIYCESGLLGIASFLLH